MADTPYIREQAESVVERPGEAWVAETPLNAGAIGLSGAVMQNVTHIAPAIAAFFFTATIVNFSGAHAPLAYLIGFLVVLALGSCLAQLARRFPSSGGYFTYVSRTVSPQAGFLTGWMYALHSPIVTGPICAYLGFILEGELQSNYGWSWFHWWMFMIVALPALTLLAYYGIKISVRTIVVVGTLEFLIVLALGISGLISPGNGGFTLRSFDYSFNPGDIATLSGFTLAIVFTVQGLTGWEAAAPLAEETENPRRNIPLAIMASIAIIGVMLIIVIWGQIIGWGVNDLSKLISSSELPALVIAHRLWGGMWFLALIAMFTSVIGASLACQNVATRMWYRMGRSGVLPSALGRVHPKHKTPTIRDLAAAGDLDPPRPRGGRTVGTGQDLHPQLRIRPGDRRHLRLRPGQRRRRPLLLARAPAGVQLDPPLRVSGRHEPRPDLLAVPVVQPVPRFPLQPLSVHRRGLAGDRDRRPVLAPDAGHRLAGEDDRDRPGAARAARRARPSIDNLMKRSYRTRFERDENPISEGGMWLNGKTDRIDWSDVITRDGHAYGAVTRMAVAERRVEQSDLGAGLSDGSLPEGDYDDPTAILAGEWGRNQHVRARVFSKNPTNRYFQEVEIRLRSSIAPHICTGYEVFWRRLKTAEGYAEIVRWNGKVGDFTSLCKLIGPEYGVEDGDEVEAVITAGSIKGIVNGREMISVSDNVFKSGSPGIGFNFFVGNTNVDHGFSHFEVETHDD